MHSIFTCQDEKNELLFHLFIFLPLETKKVFYAFLIRPTKDPSEALAAAFYALHFPLSSAHADTSFRIVID